MSQDTKEIQREIDKAGLMYTAIKPFLDHHEKIRSSGGRALHTKTQVLHTSIVTLWHFPHRQVLPNEYSRRVDLR